MLTIRTFPAALRYSELPLTSLGNAARFFANISLLVGPFNMNGSPNRGSLENSIKGFITASEKDTIGDRNCFHRDFDGFVSTYPIALTAKVRGPLQLNNEWTYKKGSYTRTVTHFVSEGDDTIQSYPFNTLQDPPAQGQGKGVLHIRTFFSNGAVGGGYALDETWWNKDHYESVVTTWVSTRKISDDATSWISNSIIDTTMSIDQWFRYQPGKRILPRVSSALSLFTPISGSHNYSFLNSLNTDTMLSLIPNIRPASDVDERIGDLGKLCVDQFQFTDVNSMSFLNEMREIGKLIPHFSGWKDPKTYASTWLWFKYGITLTVADTKALTKSISTFRETAKAVSNRIKYSSVSDVELNGQLKVFSSYHYKIVADPYENDLMKIIFAARRWNLWPKLATSWDAIPLSFVVDWVIDIQSLLSRLDVKTDAQYLNVHSSTWSQKCQTTISASELFDCPLLIGSVLLTDYRRVVESKIRLPKLKIDPKSGFGNWAELASLVVVRK